MKNLIFIISLFVVSVSYATNTLDYTEVNQVIDLYEKVESNSLKTEKNEDLACTSTISSTSTTNADGTTTRTTTTSVSCDTPGELAQFHAMMRSLGMSV